MDRRPLTDLHKIRWMHGAKNCARHEDPPLQIVPYGADTYILRQNKCLNYEAPFLYLLFGSHSVLLHDTGATADEHAFPLLPLIEQTIANRLRARNQRDIRLIITHSHGHQDHVQGDVQFARRPNTLIAPTGIEAVAEFFQMDWPNQIGSIDLGGRSLQVLGIPGHASDHIALFDSLRGLLLTGDSLYPGVLTVREWKDYGQSVRRLAGFCRSILSRGEFVAHVLGAHIEMSKTPGHAYEIGTIYQPEEHPLPLEVEHVFELEDALNRAGNTPTRISLSSYIVLPL